MMTSTPGRDSICVVCGCDDNYSRPLAVALYSMLAHLSRERSIVLYIIDGGLKAESKQRLERVVKHARRDTPLHFVAPVSEEWSHLEGHRHISVAAYLRLFIPSLLPAETLRALYLDCDLLVQADIAPLYDAGTGDNAVAAIRDYAIASTTHPWSHLPEWEVLGIDPHAPTFNTGVLLLDVDHWRKNRVSERVLDYAVRHAGELENCDQDALNAMLAHSWRRADEIWNVQNQLLSIEDLPVPDETSAAFYSFLAKNRPQLLKDAKIFHFTGIYKPWQHDCRHPATLKWALSLAKSRWFTPAESVRWLLPWLVKFSGSRLKLALGLTHSREKTGARVAPIVVQPLVVQPSNEI